MELLTLLYGGIALAVIFDFINGFHDSANAISTVVATKVLRPWQALLIAGAANFLGPFIFGVSIAKTVQGDYLNQADPVLQDPHTTLIVFLSALLGAIVWNLFTWWKGIPSSSSHALIGGLIGAGLGAAGVSGVKFTPMATWMQFAELAVPMVAIGAVLGLAASLLPSKPNRRIAMGFGAYAGFASAAVWAVLKLSHNAKGEAVANIPLGGFGNTLLFIAVSPFLGFVAAFILTMLLMAAFRKARPQSIKHTFSITQIFSSGFYSLTHGSNDGQKTVGVIMGMTVAARYQPFPGAHLSGTDIPLALVLTAATAIGLGTMFGGWRIVKTMATRLTHLAPYQGTAAETGGGVVLFFMAKAGIPVSTTHAISGSIMGVGATRHLGAVQWSVARRMVVAWIVTIPAAAIVAALSFFVASRLL